MARDLLMTLKSEHDDLRKRVSAEELAACDGQYEQWKATPQAASEFAMH